MATTGDPMNVSDYMYVEQSNTNPCNEISLSSNGVRSHTEHVVWKSPDPNGTDTSLTTTTVSDDKFTYINVDKLSLNSCSVCRDGNGFMFNSGGVCESCERTLPATQIDWLDLVGKLLAGATIGVKDEEAIKKARQLLALIPLKELIREEAIAVA